MYKFYDANLSYEENRLLLVELNLRGDYVDFAKSSPAELAQLRTKVTNSKKGPYADALRGSGYTVERIEVPRPAAIGGGVIDVYIHKPPPSPSAAPSPLLVWFHGGGMVLGDAQDAGLGPLMTLLPSKPIIASVQYRMAPEDRFPAGADDAIAAYEHLCQPAVAEALGADVAGGASVAGYSAGGLLAAVVQQACRYH
jgi:acetyl esterase